MRYGSFTKITFNQAFILLSFFLLEPQKELHALDCKMNHFCNFITLSPGRNQHNILTYKTMLQVCFWSKCSEEHLNVFVPSCVPYPQSDMGKR